MLIVGDWNADARDNRSWFHKHVAKFCEDNGYTWSSGVFLPRDSYTYVSDVWGTISWLDHCIASADGHDIIKSMEVQYGCYMSDHLCVDMILSIDLVPAADDITNSVPAKINWQNAREADIQKYSQSRPTRNLLEGISNLDEETLRCKDFKCENPEHRVEIDRYYGDVIKCLSKASEFLLRGKKSSSYTKPGWNDYIKELHVSAREIFLQWRGEGSPRQGPMFELMKRSRASFKYAVRQLKRDEERIRADNMARKMADKNYTDFWKEIKIANNSRVPLPSSIEGVSGRQNITLLWEDHFENLLNSVGRNRHEGMENRVMSESYDEVVVKREEVADAIRSLESGKSCGLDGVTAEHLKLCSDVVVEMLSVCFTCMFIHGYLPKDMLSIVLIPILKDKARNLVKRTIDLLPWRVSRPRYWRWLYTAG